MFIYLFRLTGADKTCDLNARGSRTLPGSPKVIPGSFKYGSIHRKKKRKK